MADKIQRNNVYVSKESGNSIVIEPNKVFDSSTGLPKDRYVPQEDLVYFVNLEADIVPRSKLDLGEGNSGEGNRISVAEGKVNYLGPNNGAPLDTSWTDDFIGKNNQKTATGSTTFLNGYKDFEYKYTAAKNTQLLGIKDINVKVKPDNMNTALVTIRMVDVRGRALFEKGAGSIYSTFFHLPFPQFYLTLKGYYGESVVYRLVLTNQVKISFESDGDYYITADFMATNQKLLNDISVEEAGTAPYLFQNTEFKVNDDGEVKITKTTKGFEVLGNIYQNYYKEGLIDKNLSEKPLTLPQLKEKIDRLDTFLEDELFDEADITFFSDIKRYGKVINNFETAIRKWFVKYANTQNPQIIDGGGEIYFNLKQEYQNGLDENNIKIIDGGETSLFGLFDYYIDKLSNINYFGKYKSIKLNTGQDTTIDYKKPSLSSLRKEDFYYSKKDNTLINYKFISELEKVVNQYNESFNDIKEQVENVLSEIQEKQLDFKPTLKNVMGVILANAECFIRIMDETHRLAYNQRTNPKRLKAIESKESSDSNNDIIYPFPQVYGVKRIDSANRPVELYPGDPSIKNVIGSYDGSVWPEVRLVEEYVSTASSMNDNTAPPFDVISANSVLTNANASNGQINIFGIDIKYNEDVFSERRYIDIIYRIYNRAIYSVFNNDASLDTIKDMAKADALNAQKAISKLNTGKNNFKVLLSEFRDLFSNQNYLPTDAVRLEDAKNNYFTEGNTEYLLDVESKGYIKLNLSIDNDSKSFKNSETSLVDDTKGFNTPGFELYPFANKIWVDNNLQQKSTVFSRKNATTYGSEFEYTVSQSDYDLVLDGSIHNVYINPLNAPGFVTSDDYLSKSYFLLNSIPTNLLTGTINVGGVNENYFARFIGSDVKEIKKIQILKWGSIWNRYKTLVQTGVDIIDGVWENLDLSVFNDITLSISGGTYNFTYDTQQNRFDVGFYPTLILKYLNEYTEGSYDINDIQNLINDGSLVIDRLKSVNVTDTNQVINTWNVYAIIDGVYISIPTYHLDVDNITSSDLTTFINKTVSLDRSKEIVDIDFTQTNSPLYNEYLYDIDGNLNGGSIEDLTALFSYDVLEEYEREFLLFIKNRYDTANINQQVLIDSLIKFSSLSDMENSSSASLLNVIKGSGLFSDEYLVFTDPIQIDMATLTSYVDSFVDNPVSFGSFTAPIDSVLFNSINGPVSDPQLSIIREQFFELSNIDASENNMIYFKGIVNQWTKYAAENPNPNISDFKSKLTEDLDVLIEKLNTYTVNIFSELNKIITLDDTNEAASLIKSDISGSVDIQTKKYRQFKNFNDTWVSGFDTSSYTLAGLFKYVDYLNRPIGDDFMVDLSSLKNFYNSANKSKPISTLISFFLQKNSLSEPLSMAGNINLYGKLAVDGETVKNSESVANSLFGTHTQVKKNGEPGFVVYYRSNSSEYLSINRAEYGYKDDVLDTNSNKPNNIESTVVNSKQIREGNRGVSFNVEFGVQNQNMFRDFSINSYDGVKTAEEIVILDGIANMKDNTTTASVATNLLDIIKTRVYSCKVNGLGNAMIQPFMYFNLRYIPLYSGTYLILNVEHSLSPDTGFMTAFEGVRVSNVGLANIDAAMIRANRNLFEGLYDKLLKKSANIKQNKVYPEANDKDSQGNIDSETITSQNCKLGSAWSQLKGKYHDINGRRTKKTSKELKDLIVQAANLEFANNTNVNKDDMASFAFAVSLIEQGSGDGVTFYFDNPFGLHVDGGAFPEFKETAKGYFCPKTSDGYVRATPIFHDVDNETVDDGIIRGFRSFMKLMVRRGDAYYNDGTTNNFWSSSKTNNADYLASLWAFYWNAGYWTVDREGTSLPERGFLISDFPQGIVPLKNGKTKNRSNTIEAFQKYINRFNKI